MEEFKSALNKYAIFDGRASRREYWIFILINIIIGVALQSAFSIFSAKLGLIVGAVYNLAMFIPSIAVGVRRLHDVNKSGWYLLIVFIPIVGFIWLLILNLTAGDVGENMYGPSPYNNKNIEQTVASDAPTGV